MTTASYKNTQDRTLTNTRQPLVLTHPGVNDAIINSILSTAMYTDVPMISSESILLTDDLITTAGWDTVYAVRASYVNKAIIVNHSTPQNEVSAKMLEDDDVYQISHAYFKDWQITKGGDGKLLNLSIPLKSGTYTKPSGTSYDLKDSEFTVQVKLNYIHSDSADSETGSDNYLLMVDHNQQEKVAVVVDAILPPTISTLNASIVRGIMEEWLNQNISLFHQVFCSVYVNLQTQDEKFKWLKPTYMSYAYADHDSLNNSIFSILCMTNHHSAAGLSQQVSSNLLNTSDSGAFVINSELYIQQIFIPGLQAAYAGQTVAFEQKGRTVTAKGLKLDAVKVAGISYTPVIQKFEANFGTSFITMTSNIKVNISPGIDAYMTIDTSQKLLLSHNDANEPVIIYKNVDEPTVTHRVEVAEGIIITTSILEIIIAIVSGVAAKLVETILYRVIIIVVAVICMAVIGSITLILKLVTAKGILNGLPSAKDLIQTFSAPIIWPMCDPSDPNRFVIASADYQGEIVIKGNPGFKDNDRMI